MIYQIELLDKLITIFIKNSLGSDFSIFNFRSLTSHQTTPGINPTTPYVAFLYKLEEMTEEQFFNNSIVYKGLQFERRLFNIILEIKVYLSFDDDINYSLLKSGLTVGVKKNIVHKILSSGDDYIRYKTSFVKMSNSDSREWEYSIGENNLQEMTTNYLTIFPFITKSDVLLGFNDWRIEMDLVDKNDKVLETIT